MCSMQHTEFKFQFPLNYLQIELEYDREEKRLYKTVFAIKEVLKGLKLNKIKILSILLKNIYYFTNIIKKLGNHNSLRVESKSLRV